MTSVGVGTGTPSSGSVELDDIDVYVDGKLIGRATKGIVETNWTGVGKIHLAMKDGVDVTQPIKWPVDDDTAESFIDLLAPVIVTADFVRKTLMHNGWTPEGAERAGATIIDNFVIQRTEST